MDSENRLKRLAQISATGGATGAILPVASGLVSGVMDPKALLRRAMIGGLIGGIGAPASQLAGEAIMGGPKEGERNAFTRRGALGGAALGGLAGLAGTAALSGKLPLAKLGSLGESLGSAGNVDHILLKKLKDLATSPDKIKTALGLGAGTAAGGVLGMHFGADEGMGLDTLSNELSSLRDRRQKKKLAGMSDDH